MPFPGVGQAITTLRYASPLCSSCATPYLISACFGELNPYATAIRIYQLVASLTFIPDFLYPCFSKCLISYPRNATESPGIISSRKDLHYRTNHPCVQKWCRFESDSVSGGCTYQYQENMCLKDVVSNNGQRAGFACYNLCLGVTSLATIRTRYPNRWRYAQPFNVPLMSHKSQTYV
ncbi:hypothetical protein BD779DRAFT_495343 [Infundibulicybe gibba]|nr:hypothetical protein BD779DRAFT_495343 [Infundibulicybe gibba]